MNIGGIELKSNVVFAPVAGFSDVGFRRLCAKYGAGLTYTELISAKGLVYGNPGTDALIATDPLETLCAAQLFGSDPEFMYKAAADERLKKFDIIDINLGCPVKKVFSNGDGCALMARPDLVEEIVRAVKDGAKRPVTVKMRAGIENGKPLAVECALAAQKGGADAVTVHPRYREQFYGGYADHNITKQVKNTVRIPVLANGDIIDAESLREVAALSGADGFMIARAALGNPYIFSELNGIVVERNLKADIVEHIGSLRKVYPDSVVTNLMKTHLGKYSRGMRCAKEVRLMAGEAKNLDDIFKILEIFA